MKQLILAEAGFFPKRGKRNFNEITDTQALLHGEEIEAFGDLAIRVPRNAPWRKASIRGKVEYLFGLIKRQFEIAKGCNRGLKKIMVCA